MNRRERKAGKQGSQSGVTLIPVIFIIVILAFVGVMFVSLIGTGSFTSINDLQATQALYVAEGGGEYILINKVFPNYSTGGATINLGAGSFSVDTPAYLTAPLTAAATTVTVNSTTGFLPAAGRIVIDAEQINYTGTAAAPARFTGCTRGQGGTVAAAHTSVNAAVYPATTVTVAVTAAATTITVNSTTGFLVPGVIRIENEFIYCTNKTATTFTGCVRGYKNTVAVAHTAGTSTTVFQYIITTTGTVGSAQRIVRASVTGAPAYQAAGTAVTGTGAVSPAWPAHAINDIALLFIESCGGEAATTPAPFAAVTNSPQFTGAGTLGTRITVYWARATSTAMAAPTVADPGDHVYAQIITYRGVINTGNPWDITGGGVKTPATGSVTVAGVTTSASNRLIVQAVSRDNDSAAAAFSAETNPNLTNITERSDAGTTSGNGGGFAVWDGVFETGGATGNTTATVISSINAFLMIALPPPTGMILDWREVYN